jgi:hypothetical protein
MRVDEVALWWEQLTPELQQEFRTLLDDWVGTVMLPVSLEAHTPRAWQVGPVNPSRSSDGPPQFFLAPRVSSALLMLVGNPHLSAAQAVS